ncbi:MAG: type II toxin-antitoxin system Phd/YefM family antitoxin [Acidobacteria bacterium]|nr:type II toxin-antitoxin system Phd/YefM family antitoxin [Acidobacteriota bacterium]
MTTTVEVEEAKTRLSNLLTMALGGDEVIIAEDGKPIVRLVPVAPKKKKRIAGLNRGQIKMREDFDAPLPDEFWMGEDCIFVSVDTKLSDYPVKLLT